MKTSPGRRPLRSINRKSLSATWREDHQTSKSYHRLRGKKKSGGANRAFTRAEFLWPGGGRGGSVRGEKRERERPGLSRGHRVVTGARVAEETVIGV
jgi:hypothetical protein